MSLLLTILLITSAEDNTYGGCNTDYDCERAVGYEDLELQGDAQ